SNGGAVAEAGGVERNAAHIGLIDKAAQFHPAVGQIVDACRAQPVHASAGGQLIDDRAIARDIDIAGVTGWAFYRHLRTGTSGRHELTRKSAEQGAAQRDTGRAAALMADEIGAAAAIDAARHAIAGAGFHQHIIARAKHQIAVDRAAIGHISASRVTGTAVERVVQIDVAVDGARVAQQPTAHLDRRVHAVDRAARQIGHAVRGTVLGGVADRRARGADDGAAVADGRPVELDAIAVGRDGAGVGQAGGRHARAARGADRAIVGHGGGGHRRERRPGRAGGFGETDSAVVGEAAGAIEIHRAGIDGGAAARGGQRAVVGDGERCRGQVRAGLDHGGVCQRRRVGRCNAAVQHHAAGACQIDAQRCKARMVGQRIAGITGDVVTQCRAIRIDSAVDPGIAAGARPGQRGDQRVGSAQRQIAVQHAARQRDIALYTLYNELPEAVIARLLPEMTPPARRDGAGVDHRAGKERQPHARARDGAAVGAAAASAGKHQRQGRAAGRCAPGSNRAAVGKAGASLKPHTRTARGDGAGVVDGTDNHGDGG
ncbi:hypothetical protein E4T56_gene9645, partial [Termitomyces sp. T112]